MRKNIKLLFGIVLITVVSLLAYNIYKNIQHKNTIAKQIASIPNFSFLDLQGNTFTKENLTKKPTLFYYYNSECDFCKKKASLIYENLETFKNTQVVFISHEQTNAIISFAKEYHLLEQPNITFLEDRKLIFSKVFNAKKVPYLILYDAKQKLIKQFKGGTTIKQIINHLPKNEK